MANQTIHSLPSMVNTALGNIFNRQIRTYQNITIPSTGYIQVDSYENMEEANNLYLLSMTIRGWTGNISGVTIVKGTSGRELYLVGEPNKTITTITVEYVFSNY